MAWWKVNFATMTAFISFMIAAAAILPAIIEAKDASIAAPNAIPINR